MLCIRRLSGSATSWVTSLTIVSFQRALVFSQKMAAVTASRALAGRHAEQVLGDLGIGLGVAVVELVPIVLAQRLVRDQPAISVPLDP